MPKVTQIGAGTIVAGVLCPIVIKMKGKQGSEPAQEAPEKREHRPFLSEAHTPEETARAIGFME